MVKTVGKYDLYGTLGEGAFGKVKYAVNTETNEAVAIKILDKDKIQARNMGAQIKKEISIMKMINHHYVVGVKDVFATSAKIFIVLEFVGGGELFDKIANEGKLSEDKARFYFRQLVEGLEHCHNNGICHRDLKPENLLLDTEGNLKISDFGFSTLNIGDADGDGDTRAELLHTTCGTPNYVAPEVLGKDGYDGKKADVWSIGVILFVLLAGYLPFDENTMAQLFQKIKAAEFELPSFFSPEAKDLISRILVPNPQERARIPDLKKHEWYTKKGTEPPYTAATTLANSAKAQSDSDRHANLPPPPPSKTQQSPQKSSKESENVHPNTTTVTNSGAFAKSKDSVPESNTVSNNIPTPSSSNDDGSEVLLSSGSSERLQQQPSIEVESPKPPKVEKAVSFEPVAATPAVAITDCVAVPESEKHAEVALPGPKVQLVSPPVVGGGGGLFGCFGCGSVSVK